jgi:hypothetical protein
MLQHLAVETPPTRGPGKARIVTALAVLAATALTLAGVMTVRAALSLSEAGGALAAGDSLAAVQALDRCLAEAPPFAQPIRRRASDALERIALDDSDPTSAWYATLFMISAAPTDERHHWQTRSLRLAPRGLEEAETTGPFIPIDATPPSAAWSAVATLSLVAWIALLGTWLAAPWPWARSPRLPVAAALLWLLWLTAVISA